ncbi:MAG: hypothetical protein NXH75_08140, partial [Halobacteriovoraceae bacterium]|nr:hypothetical protein [Halobacteriovoraceae bacterium]
MASIFDKTIQVPSSKSYANRLLILAAINPRPIEVLNLPLSSDVETMISCLREIGLVINETKNGVLVKNSFPECEKEEEPLVLDTKDGGTTNRFLVPFLARGKRKYILEPEGHMRDRPMADLLFSLNSLEVKTSYNKGDDWITVQGPIVGEKVEVECSKTTQFLTGIALALSDTEIEVIPKNLTVSLPYWELTKELLKWGKSEKNKYVNPVDYSSLSYPLALAAVTGKVLITNCNEIDPNQADSMFLSVLKEMGARVEFSKEGLLCEKNDLKGVS